MSVEEALETLRSYYYNQLDDAANVLAEMLQRLQDEIDELNAELNECRKRLYGFMLDCNAVGLEQAGKNLHRGLKEKNFE
jgi:uncharacterized protein YPO0396